MYTAPASLVVLLLLALSNCKSGAMAADNVCLANPTLNADFVSLLGLPANSSKTIPLADSCCQADVCGIPCPAVVPDPGIGKMDEGLVA